MVDVARPSEVGKCSRDEVVGHFRRVPDGLDPDQVYAYARRMSDRIERLEARVQRASGTAIVETALRQAVDIRSEAFVAAERAYDEIVGAAEAEAAGRRAEAAHEAQALLDEARTGLATLHRRIEALIATRAAPASPEEAAPSIPSMPASLEAEPTRYGCEEGTRRDVCAARSTPESSGGHATARDEATESGEPFRLPSWLEG